MQTNQLPTLYDDVYLVKFEISVLGIPGYHGKILYCIDDNNERKDLCKYILLCTVIIDYMLTCNIVVYPTAEHDLIIHITKSVCASPLNSSVDITVTEKVVAHKINKKF